MKAIRTIFVKTILLMLLVGFIVFYPMFISIYVFLPLMIGFMGYILHKGIEENNLFYIVISLVYLINLDLNLSLPIFLSIVASLIVYILLKNSFIYKIRCNICISMVSVFMIDFLYLGLLLSYDFIFQTQSVILDELLLYSLLVDMLVVVIL